MNLLVTSLQLKFFFKSSISLVEEMRVLLQNKDEWKISFRNKPKVYNSLCGLQVQQGTEDIRGAFNS